MSQTSRIAVSLSLLFLLALTGVALPLAIAQFSGESSQAANIVVLIQGHPAIKRKNCTGFAPLTFGANLQTGDLLRMDESSVAKVVCSDLKLREIGTGLVGTPCTPSQEILRRADGSLLRPTRTVPSEAWFPIVLSPRRTKLLSGRPLLRWTEVKDASTYHLMVRGPELLWTETVHSKTELQYPDYAPKLEAGQNYKLIVAISDEQNSGNESANGLGFSVLSSNERMAVLDEQKQLERLGLEEDPTQYVIGHLYASHGLNAEAIERLEAVSKKFMVPATERPSGRVVSERGGSPGKQRRIT